MLLQWWVVDTDGEILVKAECLSKAPGFPPVAVCVGW